MLGLPPFVQGRATPFIPLVTIQRQHFIIPRGSPRVEVVLVWTVPAVIEEMGAWGLPPGSSLYGKRTRPIIPR